MQNEWIICGRTVQGRIVWTKLDDEKRIYQVTSDHKAPSASSGGYYKLETLLKIKDDKLA